MMRTQFLGLFVVSFLTLTSGLVIPERRQIPTAIEVEIIPTTSSTTSSATPTVTSATTSPTPTTRTFDEGGEYMPPPPPPQSYYEDQGAQGDSQGFINVSIGAQAGIIIAIVVVGLGIMGGCIWFWNKKQAEWKAALERRRTLRASRIAAKKVGMPLTPGLAGSKEAHKKSALGPDRARKSETSKGLKEKKKTGSIGSSGSSVVSTEVTVVEQAQKSQFDVLTPTDEVDPWWRKVVPKKK